MDPKYFKINFNNFRCLNMCQCIILKVRPYIKNFDINRSRQVGVLFDTIELLIRLDDYMTYDQSIYFESEIIEKDSKNNEIYIINFSNNIKYIGSILNGKFHGEGKLFLGNKLYYIGEFENNLFHGNGELFSNYCDHYLGEFSEGCVTGIGEVKWCNGNQYSGSFRNNLIDGYGTYNLADGSFYNGYHVNGEKSGLGIYTSVSDDGVKTEFISEFWSGNILYGRGTIKCESNSFYYSGDIRALISRQLQTYILPHGTGKLQNKSNVDIHVGKFRYGLKEGIGNQYHDNGNKKYSGFFFQDKYEGPGKLYDSSGSNIFDGNFHLGKKHGEGWILDGDSSELTNFKNDKKFGRCIHTNRDLKICCNYYYEEKIVSQKYKNLNETENSLKSNCDTCSICLSTFNDKSLITKLPKCGHIFHSECLFNWLQDNESCPICRDTNLFKENNEKKRKLDDT